MLEWILRSIHSNEVNEVILAVNYLADVLKYKVGDRIGNIDILYSLESKTLGTGGPIKNSENKLKDNGTFLTMNGDILAEIPLKRMHKFHSDMDAMVTVALHQVKDPTRFGVVEFDENSRIKRFIEKPRIEAPSNWINAGIYLMEPEIIELIPSNKKVSLEREIFPHLAKQGKLFGFRLEGTWFDVGNIEDYMRANYIMIKKESELKPLLSEGVDVKSDANLFPPLIIRKNVKVGNNSTIGPNSVISQNSYIGKNSIIKNSIIFENVEIGDSAEIEGAIVGGDVHIGNNVKIGQKCVISDHVTIHDKLTISKGAVICPHKEVEKDVKTHSHIK